MRETRVAAQVPGGSRAARDPKKSLFGNALRRISCGAGPLPYPAIHQDTVWVAG